MTVPNPKGIRFRPAQRDRLHELHERAFASDLVVDIFRIALQAEGDDVQRLSVYGLIEERQEPPDVRSVCDTRKRYDFSEMSLMRLPNRDGAKALRCQHHFLGASNLASSRIRE